MVVKMMRWRPWPPLVTRKYEVIVVMERVEGVVAGCEGAVDQQVKLTAEIRWKGPKLALMSSLRKATAKKDSTKEASHGQNGGVFQWEEEEFQNVCHLSSYKDSNVFHPWEIGFTVLNGVKSVPKNKVLIIGFASLNLAEYASATEEREFDLTIPLTLSGSIADAHPSLHIKLSLLELRTTQEHIESLPRSIVPVLSPPEQVDTTAAEKDEHSALKAGLRKVKILTEYVSTRRAKKASRKEESSEGRFSATSEDGDYPFDSDSFDEFGEGETDEGKENSSVRKSFSYGTLAYANYAGRLFFSSARINSEDEDLVYYSNRKSDVGCSVNEDSSSLVCEPPLVQSSKRSILPWRKRKLNFRSPKAKGEPLLKKAYAEEGGDDIDFDRRQLSSDESLPFGWQKTEDDSGANRSSISEFGDDSFAVGSWEHREIISRDGHMKLQAEVFFASIDQRSERAAGESACTALVAVIADWFQNNGNIMPIKSQFDSLIRDGSMEWRNLCEKETYRERFPDKHFDLETVLQAKIRPLSVHSRKSFIGFFHPYEMDEDRFDFLHGAMTFDAIWDEISCAGSECLSNGEPLIYIVSWNDHFFILKVETDAYYIIDTLGERLHEGCDQAYILKFNRDTKIFRLPSHAQSSEGKPESDQQPDRRSGLVDAKADETAKSEGEEEEMVVSEGKDACKEYIKNFLAMIPIRELLTDLKKGLVGSTPLHHRLQIEFHYTQLQPPSTQSPANAHEPTEVATVTEIAA